MIITATNHRGKVEMGLEKILSIFASDDDVYVQTIDSEYKVPMKLYDFEEYPEFIRINKSEVINVTKIKDAMPLFNSKIKLVLIDERVVYVNRTYIKAFRAYLTGGVK